MMKYHKPTRNLVVNFNYASESGVGTSAYTCSISKKKHVKTAAAQTLVVASKLIQLD